MRLVTTSLSVDVVEKLEALDNETEASRSTIIEDLVSERLQGAGYRSKKGTNSNGTHRVPVAHKLSSNLGSHEASNSAISARSAAAYDLGRWPVAYVSAPKLHRSTTRSLRFAVSASACIVPSSMPRRGSKKKSRRKSRSSTSSKRSSTQVPQRPSAQAEGTSSAAGLCSGRPAAAVQSAVKASASGPPNSMDSGAPGAGAEGVESGPAAAQGGVAAARVTGIQSELPSSGLESIGTREQSLTSEEGLDAVETARTLTAATSAAGDEEAGPIRKLRAITSDTTVSLGLAVAVTAMLVGAAVGISKVEVGSSATTEAQSQVRPPTAVDPYVNALELARVLQNPDSLLREFVRTEGAGLNKSQLGDIFNTRGFRVYRAEAARARVRNVPGYRAKPVARALDWFKLALQQTPRSALPLWNGACMHALLGQGRDAERLIVSLSDLDDVEAQERVPGRFCTETDFCPVREETWFKRRREQADCRTTLQCDDWMLRPAR